MGKPGSKINDGSISRMGDGNIVHYARVVDNIDNDDGGRIKARIKGIDDKFGDDELPNCYPLLPNLMHVRPNIGETVKILLHNPNSLYDEREYIGPIISQIHKFKHDPYYFSSRSTQSRGLVEPEESASQTKDVRDLYPNNDEVTFMGRYNTYLRQKKNEIELAAGMFQPNQPLKANKHNKAFIQLKLIENGERSYSNIVADNINLVAYRQRRYNIDEMSQEELEEILSPTIKGDALVELLQLFRNFVSEHTHPYSDMAPNDLQGSKNKILEFDLERILNKHIKIN